MPNMVLLAPSDETEMKLALDFAIQANKPIVIRYPKATATRISDMTRPGVTGFDRSACAQPYELGKGTPLIKNQNSTAVILNYGALLPEAIAAAELLAEENISVDVINARFAAPIDENWLFSACKGKTIVTLEDHTIDAGFGSAVLELAAQSDFENKVKVLGVPKTFIKHDSRNSQLMQAGLNADKIAQSVKETLIK
jgi:1-deoxy-D-xylulose-5-phosphate synthase